MIQSDDARKKRKIGLLTILGICLIMLIPAIEPLCAQTSDNEIGFGLGFGLSHIAEDQDYSNKGTPLNLFFDWDITEDLYKIRFGYNQSQAELKFSHYNKSWESELETNNIYVAYRYEFDIMEDLQAFGMVGLSWIFSNFSMNNGAESRSYSGMGTVFGGGIFYFLSDFGFGTQLDIYSGKGNFDGVTISTGSTQILLVAVHTF